MKEHYYIEKPKAEFRKYLIKDTLRGFELTFNSASGVFSATQIDNGTRVLIENMQIKGNVLDLGCGYGAVGIVAAKLCPKCQVILTDINRRAVMLAKQNLKLNKIKNAEVRKGNLYTPVKDEKFDVILLNPPMSAGRKLCLEMIHKAPKYLKSKGSLQIVAKKNKGGEFLFKEMDKIFKRTEVLAKKTGFWVYKGEI